MKKIYLVVGLVVMLVIGAGVYFFYNSESDYGPAKPPKDLTNVIVQPVQFPMKGKTFTVPNMPESTVVLDLVSPTAKRDYPMGRFTTNSGTSSVSGTLVALDDFTSSFENNKRAVPISVSTSTQSNLYYLAILEGEDMHHLASLPIGDHIKIMSVTRSGDQISVNYLVHARGQLLDEVPEVQTTAIFDIGNTTIVQAGRTPATEEVVVVKSFSGKYLWKETRFTDGDRTVTPVTPDVFTLTFDANRISLGTDCNTGGAEFSVGTGSSTEFTVREISTTKMFCESAQEGEYFDMFKQVSSYTEAADGTLTLHFKDSAGSMIFTATTPPLEFESSPEATTSSST